MAKKSKKTKRPKPNAVTRGASRPVIHSGAAQNGKVARQSGRIEKRDSRG